MANLLFLCNKDIKNPIAGGGTWAYFRLMKRLVQNGHDVTLLCPKYRNCLREENVEGIEIRRVGSDFSFFVRVLLINMFSRAVREYDAVIEVLIYGLPFYTKLISGKPTMAICWHLPKETFFDEFETHFGKIKGWLLATFAYFIEEKILPVFYRQMPMFTFSKSSEDQFLELGFKDVIMVPWALDRAVMFKSLSDDVGEVTTWYNPKVGKTDFPSAVVLGRLKYYKGVQDAIRATRIVTKNFPETRLFIVGTGDYRSKLIELTKELSLERHVLFLGYVSHEKKIEILQKSLFLIMPSYREGYATPVLESSMCGTPAIATDAPGVKDYVEHGKTGLIYHKGDYKELAEYMAELFLNENLRKHVSAQSLKWAQAFLAKWQQNEDQFVALFEGRIREICLCNGT